ncbi:GNAT family N-acetyltransferase [uncultured Jatrophihabitans sp.]|uniref:GNAT family N-acetyltransferase n=1 Tax=uncultured Jatrophihabitans sp. TaxID=1610747 RepID=UPI0035C9D57F
MPAGCSLRRVDDEDGLVDYLDVIAEVYQLAEAPRAIQESVLFSLASARDPAMSVFLLYEGDRALSASANFVSGGCGGMQWTGTRREAKGRGLGQVVCAAAWASAFDRGEDLVVGQSSTIGTPVWLGMGFEQVTRYRRFMSPPARNARS